jgi:hypothetical protein
LSESDPKLPKVPQLTTKSHLFEVVWP